MTQISMTEWGFTAGRFGVVLAGLVFVLFWSCTPDPRRVEDFPIRPECWMVPNPDAASGTTAICKYELPDGAICYSKGFQSLSCSR
jgi:hypothetical protein